MPKKRPRDDERTGMSEHRPGDERHQHESPLLHAQEHKGYGDDEGEREQLLAPDDDRARRRRRGDSDKIE